MIVRELPRVTTPEEREKDSDQLSQLKDPFYVNTIVSFFKSIITQAIDKPAVLPDAVPDKEEDALKEEIKRVAQEEKIKRLDEIARNLKKDTPQADQIKDFPESVPSPSNDAQMEKEDRLIEELNTVFNYATEKLDSIDSGIQDLVALFKAKDEKDEKKQKEADAEQVQTEREEVVSAREKEAEKLVERGESLESSNKEETLIQKTRRRFGEDFRLNLAAKLPFLSMFSDSFDPNKIGTENDPFRKKEDNKSNSNIDLKVAGLAAAAGAMARGLALATAKIAAFAAGIATVGAALAVIGVFGKETQQQTIGAIDNILGVDKQDRKAMNKFMDENVNPVVEGIGDFISRPFQSTTTPEKPATTPVPPPAAPVKKPDVGPAALNMNRAASEAKKAENKRMASASMPIVQQVINNNNNNSKSSATTIVLGGSRGALDFALA